MLLELFFAKPIILVTGFLISLGALYMNRLLRRGESHSTPYPPGPDAPTMPTRNVWAKYREWGEKYGDVVYISTGRLLVLNSLNAAVDLLEKRARIYSDRPFSEMLRISNVSVNWSLSPYSEDWRQRRKIFHQNFRADAARQFLPAQHERIHQYLHDLTTTPEDFQLHTLSLSQGIIFSAVYGLSFSATDQLAQIAVSAVHAMTLAITPGEFNMIESFPWLRHLPLWFPGWRFQRVAEKCGAELKVMHTVPFEMAMERKRSGSGSSLIAELAAQHEGDPEKVELVKSIGTMSYIAATDTTMGSIGSFLLAMTLHPDLQTKGQEEIDRVVGRDRLPTLDDRNSLPYIESIYQEVMRLLPPVPLGVPHKTMEDDIYRGFHIPKGTTVIANILAMNLDETLYEEPEAFRPERYLDSPNGPFRNINEIPAFGFGRRVCAGRHMADATVWITIASVLATLNLSKAKDADGSEIEILEEYVDGFFRYPKPYRCSITPRSKQAETLIKSLSSLKE